MKSESLFKNLSPFQIQAMSFTGKSMLRLWLVLSLSALVLVQSHGSIYGVRWSLADRFSYYSVAHVVPENPNQNYYALCFNSDSRLDGDVYIKIRSTSYTCSNRQIQVDLANFEGTTGEDSDVVQNVTQTVIYRCFIAHDLYDSTAQSDLEYEIYTSQPIFMKEVKNSTKNSTYTPINREVRETRQILFVGYFRPPPPSSPQNQSNNVKFLTFGDWGVDSSEKVKDVLPSMMASLQADPEISLVIFLGDLAYDFVGEKYFRMLVKMQPLTSRVCFMVTPGNHDYIYHQQSFQLFSQTFLSPIWDGYYGFYYNFIVGKVLFIQYTPEKLIYKENYEININPLDKIRQDFSDFDIQFVSRFLHVIVFTHYPVYCSNTEDDSINSCKENSQRLAGYLDVFERMGLDMYISGHVHSYERSHEVCTQSGMHKPTHQVEDVDVYGPLCPIFIIEGAGGNVVQMDSSYAAGPYSAAVSYGTGFGLVYIAEYSGQNHRIFYQHLKVGEGNLTTVVADSWIRLLSPLSNEYGGMGQQLAYIQVFIIVLLLLLICSTCLYANYGLPKKSKNRVNRRNSHQEMVEQEMQSGIQEMEEVKGQEVKSSMPSSKSNQADPFSSPFLNEQKK